MKKKLLFIFIALGFFSLSRGLWYNFQSLWLQENGLSLKTISTVTSLSSLGCVAIMLCLFHYITKKRLQNFLSVLLLLKVVILIALFCLNQSNLYLVIKLLIMFDIIVDTEISISIYPFLTLFQQNDKLYCQKDLIISTFYDLGILIEALLLGKSIRHIDISFNLFLLISILCAGVAFLMIWRLPKENIEEETNTRESLFSLIRKDKISKTFLSFVLIGNISYYLITGLKVLLLTNLLSFSPNKTANYLLCISLISDLVGFLVLKYFTFQNNYINYFIKFGGRLAFYMAAIIINTPIAYLIALSYTLLISNSYSHVTDAPYINRYPSEYQLGFCNIRNIASYTAQSIGIALYGIIFTFGLQSLFVLAAIFAALQVILSFRMYRLKRKEEYAISLRTTQL